jgi:two-component system sensor histidine kinase DevS
MFRGAMDEQEREPRPIVRNLRWLSVLLAAVLVAAFLVAVTVPPSGIQRWIAVSIAVVVALGGTLAFSQWARGIVDKAQQRLVRQNEELASLTLLAGRRAEQLAALNDAAVSLTSDLTLEAVLQKVVDLSREVVSARYGALGVLGSRGEIERFITSGISAEERSRIGAAPQGKGVLGALLREGKPLRIADLSRDSRSAGFPPQHPTMTSFLGVPVAYKGRVIGNLYLTDKQGGQEFSREDQEALSLFASQAATAIENARLYEEERRRADEWKALFQLGALVAASLDIPSLFSTIVERAQQLLGTEVAMLSLLSPDGNELVVTASTGLRTEAMRSFRWRIGESVSGVVFSTGEPVIVEDYSRDPRLRTPPLGAIVDEGLASWIVTRFAAKGKALGALHVANRSPTRFSRRDAELLQSFANLAAVAVENAELYGRVQQLAVLEERDRIGMDLHDGVIQSLYAVGLNLEGSAEDVHERPSDVRSRLEKAIGDLNQVIKDIRNYIFNLRPADLSRSDIVQSLSDLIKEVRSSSLLDATLEVNGNSYPAVSEEQTVNLYHIAQEALRNTQKHAQATSVVARLDGDATRLRLSITDNGLGFDATRPVEPTHRGLLNMAERARSIGSRLEIRSEPGKGTCVYVEVPLPSGGEA